MNWKIVSPPYSHTSAGIRVLYRLNDILNELGQSSQIQDWKTPCEITDEIVVYPEIIPGNPLKAKNVVRYLLNEPGVLGGDRTFPANELIIYYDHWIHEAGCYAAGYRLPDSHLCYISVIEPELFRETNKPKTKAVSFVGKGAYTQKTPVPTMEITREFPKTREATSELLQETTDFYSYDFHTALNLEAKLCGAKIWISRGWEWFPLPVFSFDAERMWEDKSGVENLIRNAKIKF